MRPEFVTLAGGGAGLPVKIEKINDLGRIRLAKVSFEGHAMVATLTGEAPPEGDACIAIETSRIHIYVDGHRVSEAGRP